MESLKTLIPTSLLEELQQDCLICRPDGPGNWPHCECHELKAPRGGEDGWNLVGYKIHLLFHHLLELTGDLNKLRTTLEAAQQVYPRWFTNGVNTVFTVGDDLNPARFDLTFSQTTLMDSVIERLRTGDADQTSIANLISLGSNPVKVETIELYCSSYDYQMVTMLMADPFVRQYRSQDPDINEVLDQARTDLNSN